MRTLRRIAQDLRDRRHVEVYVVSAVTVVVALLSLLGDLVPANLRWSVVLATLALLTYQLAVPDHTGDPDSVLFDRAQFQAGGGLADRLESAREVCIYGPSAVNLLSESVMGSLRTKVLCRTEGRVRVAILDPDRPDAVAIAERQLDGATAFPTIELPQALGITTDRLRKMAGWSVAGTFEYRYVPYNPGFSIVAIDPSAKDGVVLVEFHGLQNEATGSRMHVELTRASSAHWHAYWLAQFEQLWGEARPPA
jgi:hypothetical protein